MELGHIPCWYWFVAIVWGAYQGFRGAVEHNSLHQERERQLEIMDSTHNVKGEAKYRPRDRWERWVVLYIHDFAFRFVCTVGGFVSLWAAHTIAISFQQPCAAASFTAGSTALLVLSFLIGIIGIGGQLHYVILAGRLPKYPG